MGMYSDLTDEELTAKIVRYRTAVEQLELGGELVKVQGEGRLNEFTQGNAGAARNTLEELLFERRSRSGDDSGRGYALDMRFLP